MSKQHIFSSKQGSPKEPFAIRAISNVLLIADDASIMERLQLMLTENRRIHPKTTTINFLKSLELLTRENFDVILWGLPESGKIGMTMVDKLMELVAQSAVIVLVEKYDSELALDLARNGIQDVLQIDTLSAETIWHKVSFTLERKKSELQKRQLLLRQSDERYTNIVDHIEYGYYETDLAGRFTFFNDAMQRMIGVSRQELLGMTTREFMDEKTSNFVGEMYKQVYQSGKPNTNIQYSRTRKDGRIVHIECTASLIKDDKGQSEGFRGIARDVTERKNAEERLRQSEERYRTIVESIEDAYYELDPKGRLVAFNAALSNIHGYTQDELMGMHYRQYLDEANAEKAKKAYTQVFITGHPIKNLQLESVAKDGSRRYSESSISLVKDATGQPIGFRGIIRDVTERKEVELQLQSAKEDAEQATRAKSEFLANMSHEIRTPMNGVLGMYNLLLGTNLDAEQSDYVETGKRSATNLLAIINDILDFSKVEAGKLELEILDFDLRRAMEEVVELPALEAHQKGLELIYHIDERVPSLLRGDPGRLRQVITNLCNNAIKFTKSGEVTVRLTSEEQSKSHIKIRFEVEDTGIGISAANQGRLFKSFHQVDASTTRKYGGTGLGLAICRQLVALMDGDIGVKSKVGKGSTFWFTARFERQPHIQEKHQQLPASVLSKRILVVDDNKTNLDILVGYLTSWGCSCDAARSGEMALSMMHALAKVDAPFDLVITDYRMPEMDGAQLGKQIKADPKLKDTILMMLTSQGLRGDAARMKRIGFSAYLTKPIRRSQLFDSLAIVLGTHASRKNHEESELVTRHTVQESRRKQIRILLAEDNTINRKLALHLLEKFGFQADAVANGLEALKALETAPYHLVLMDVQMPEMDGLEATKTIRNQQSAVRDHNIPIIALTAHAMKGDREICMDAGMNDYITKPIKPEELFSAIERHIAKKIDGNGDPSEVIE